MRLTLDHLQGLVLHLSQDIFKRDWYYSRWNWTGSFLWVSHTWLPTFLSSISPLQQLVSSVFKRSFCKIHWFYNWKQCTTRSFLVKINPFCFALHKCKVIEKGGCCVKYLIGVLLVLFSNRHMAHVSSSYHHLSWLLKCNQSILGSKLPLPSNLDSFPFES